MKYLKIVLALFVLISFSCTNENTSFAEYQLQYNENNAIDDLVALNKEVFDIAFANRHDLEGVLEDENSIIHQKLLQLNDLIFEMKTHSPNLNITEILKVSSENKLMQIYNEGEDNVAEYTPCTEAFAVSATTAVIAYTVSVISSAGSALPIATGLYYVALGTAAYNWCNCMENNYDDFDGC